MSEATVVPELERLVGVVSHALWVHDAGLWAHPDGGGEDWRCRGCEVELDSPAECRRHTAMSVVEALRDALGGDSAETMAAVLALSALDVDVPVALGWAARLAAAGATTLAVDVLVQAASRGCVTMGDLAALGLAGIAVAPDLEAALSLTPAPLLAPSRVAAQVAAAAVVGGPVALGDSDLELMAEELEEQSRVAADLGDQVRARALHQASAKIRAAIA